MITRLVWTTWTPMSAVPKMPLNLTTHPLTWVYYPMVNETWSVKIIQWCLLKAFTKCCGLSRQMVFHDRQNKHDFVKKLLSKWWNMCGFPGLIIQVPLYIRVHLPLTDIKRCVSYTCGGIYDFPPHLFNNINYQYPKLHIGLHAMRNYVGVVWSHVVIDILIWISNWALVEIFPGIMIFPNQRSRWKQ